MPFFKSKASPQPDVELSEAELEQIHGGKLVWEQELHPPELTGAALRDLNPERQRNVMMFNADLRSRF